METTAIILAVLAIPLMAYLARSAGGGQFGRSVWSPLPEMLFGLVIGAAVWLNAGHWYCGAAAALWSYFNMEAGHGNFYAMKGSQGTRIQKLELFKFPQWTRGQFVWVQSTRWGFRPLYEKLFGDITHPGYSWFMMGVKGTLIGLPLFPFGLLLAVLWPASYYLGFRIIKRDPAPEWYSGGSAGLCVALYLAFMVL